MLFVDRLIEILMAIGAPLALGPVFLLQMIFPFELNQTFIGSVFVLSGVFTLTCIFTGLWTVITTLI